jgi:Cytochrome oxidase complex assembly protein 1
MLWAFFIATICLILAWELRFQKRIRAPLSMAITAAHRSTEVNQLTGAPMKAGLLANGHFVGDDLNGTADFTFQIRGPLGRGSLIEWAQEGSGRWNICSLRFRLSDNSKVITLVDDAYTHCERE